MPDRISDIKLHVKHTSCIRSAKNSDSLTKCRQIIDISAIKLYIKTVFQKKTMSPNPPIGSGDKSADNAHFYSLYSEVTLKIRSRSPKSNQFF